MDPSGPACPAAAGLAAPVLVCWRSINFGAFSCERQPIQEYTILIGPNHRTASFAAAIPGLVTRERISMVVEGVVNAAFAKTTSVRRDEQLPVSVILIPDSDEP